MTIDYVVKISPDKCTFSGMEYKTFFTDLCRVEQDGDALRLYYIEQLDGDGFTDHSEEGLIATLYLKNGRFSITSPVIANKDWDYDKKLLLEKQ